MGKRGKDIRWRFRWTKGGLLHNESVFARELSKMLSTLPLWGVTKWDIHSMVPFTSVLERAKEQANGLKAMASRMP